MAEVLILSYSAASESFVVDLDATDEDGVVLVGAPHPRVALRLSDLSPEDADAFADLLQQIEGLARGRYEGALDPAAQKKLAGELAMREHLVRGAEADLERRAAALEARERALPPA